MEPLRLGRVPDPLGLGTNEFEEPGANLFKSSGEAYRQDVAPRTRESAPVQLAQAPQAGSFKFDLYGGPSQPAASPPAPAKKDGVFKFDLYGGEAKPEVAPAKPAVEQGDTSRGFSAALGQTPALLKGAVGFAGAAGEKTFGEGGMFTALKKYGLEGYKKGMGEIEARAKETDDVTVAWDKAKQGDLGALVDWAQYGVGYLGGNIVETVGTSVLGGLVGGAMTGPAAPVGATGGAVAGVVGKEAVKGVAKNLIEGMVAKEAAKLAEKAGVETATDVMVRQATKNVAKSIGAGTALAGSAIIKETGGIYAEREEQAKKEGRELDGGDLARVFGAGVVAGMSEMVVDKLGLDVAAGKIKIPGGGRVGRAFVGGVAGVGIEGGQELFQTAVERAGAGQALTGEEAMRDYINSFALGGLGGGTVGAISGALRSGKQDSDTVRKLLDDAQKEMSSDDGRAEVFTAMMNDEKLRPILEANNIQSGDDPRFQSVITRAISTQKMLAELEAPTPQQQEAKRKEREADVQAAFGDTASTAVGSNMGANEPLIQRESVTPNEETKTLEGVAQPVSLPGTDQQTVTDQQTGTLAMSGEDLVSAKQGFQVLPAFSTGGTPLANRFVSMNQAETFLFGPVNKETGEREGGYASSVEDMEFQIRQGKRSKETGGGTFYFIEGRAKPADVTATAAPTTATAAPTTPAPGSFDFPIANVRRPNGAIGNQGVTESRVFDVLTNVAGMNLKGDMSMREMVDAFKADSQAQQRLRDFTAQNPAVVTALPDGSFDLNDGNHRTFLLNQIGDETVRAVIKNQPTTGGTNATQTGTQQQGGQPERRGTDVGVPTEGKDRKQQTTKQASSTEASAGNRTEQGGTKQKTVTKTEPKKTVEQEIKEKQKSKRTKTTKVDEKTEPTKRDEEQKKADEKIGKQKADPKKVIEDWEDNDDGQSPHVAWDNLSDEAKKMWTEAVEDGYNNIMTHDLIVDGEAKNARVAREPKARPMFRQTKGGKGMSVEAVGTFVDRMVKAWKNVPAINIVQSVKDLPEVLQRFITRAEANGKVPGIYWRGEVYLIADSLVDNRDVGITVMHEVAGHFGLRSILGENFGKTMDQIYDGNATVRKLADAMMKKEGLTRQEAVEEVLADMAQDRASPNREFLAALRQLFAAIRKWARDTLGVTYMSDNDVREIVANARRFVVSGEQEVATTEAEPALARQKGAPTFYSQLERETRGAKQEKATAKDWKAILSKLPGVKKEEVEWTGVDNWLDLPAQQNRQITKQEVLNWIAGNKLRLNDVLLYGRGRFLSEGELVTMYEEQFVGREEEMPLDPYTQDRETLLDELGLASSETGTKHAQLTLKGGREYAELALMEVSGKTKPYKRSDEIHMGDVTKGRAIGWLRMKIRKDKQGNDVLFLEELQSQRGQDMGKGFDVPPAPFVGDTRAWTALLLKRAIAYAQEQGIDRIAWTTGEQQNERYKFPGDELLYTLNKADNTYKLTVARQGREIHTAEGVSPEKLKEYVGEKSSEYITNRDNSYVEDDKTASGVIRGDDLKLMAANLAPYYNQTVPSVSKDIIKKYGGSVEVMELEDTGKQLGFVIPESLRQIVAEDGLPMFRRKDYEAQYADLPESTRQIALAKGHYSPPSIRERLESLKPNLWLRVVQGTFDRFRSVRDIDMKAYIMLRMSSATDGAVEGLLHYGQVFNDDGALNVKKGTKGLIEIMRPLGGETDRFLLWLAANRASNLAKEERERFFKPDEIKALQKLNAGSMKDGKSRYAVYAEVQRQMNELNKSVLELARDTGLIDAAAFKRFSEDVWYVPFYRQMDEDGTLSAANTSSAAVGQYLSKKLKGSERPLNDLMQNVLMNWSHILSASMKNAAANETLKAASSMNGVVSRLTQVDNRFGKDAAGNVVALKYAVKVMENGKEVYYNIEDEFLLASLDAVASIPSYGMWTTLGREAKTTLTRLISLSPTFKINNLIRDSIQSIGLSELSGSPMANVMQGWRAYKDNRAEALVGGGLFSLGNAFDGDRSAAVKRLINKGADKADILTTQEKATAWFKKFQDKYDEVSDASENANRIALYEQMRAKGATHLEAAYAARDLQDFGLQGSWVAIRYAAMLLPYFNARLQGMYKLGRDGITPNLEVLLGTADDNARQKAAKFNVVLGAVTLAGLALYLSQKDDDDWKKREEWDRDSFFWFKIPGTKHIVRVPKPFEMGAVASVIERFTEQIVDSEAEGKVFGARLLAILHDNLAINPIPQVVRPLYDIARNKDGFTDRPIESTGKERLSPEMRVNPNTSAAAVGLGKINAMFANFASAVTGGAVNADNMKLSPIQYDYLLRGYLGWLGTVIETTSNVAARPFKAGETPDMKVDDILVVGNFVKEVPSSQSKYTTSFYENAKQIATANADYRAYLAAGRIDEAKEVLDAKRDLIVLNKLYTNMEDKLSTISKRMQMINDDERMSGEEKRLELDRLAALRIELARRVEEVRISRKKGE